MTFTTPPKKLKKEKSLANHAATPSLAAQKYSLDNYTWHLEQLHKQLEKKCKCKDGIISLMQLTSANRHAWILDDKPSIKEILSKFPPLKEFEIVVCMSCSYYSYSIHPNIL